MAVRADVKRNRERLLRAGAEVFAECGTGGSVNAIAKRAGLTKMTLYRHFPSKEELLYAIMAEHYDRLVLVAGEESERPGSSPRAALEAYMERAVEQLTPDRAYFHVALMAGAESDSLRTSALRLDEAVTRVLTRAQADGTVRADLTAGDVHSLVVAISAALAPEPRRFLALLLDSLDSTDVVIDEPPMRFEDFGTFQAELVRRRALRQPG